ncbi:hypothetical protein EC973_001445 [Apophysomyces ossiformis]|uniref:Guanylate cyclase domain-containing protein n=1 Tax=Apophysomyces ossiformis TaxID=679940 RepID=A0A8H7BP98_9FUNG|nr:hypothetical protein EC973_001445 [Apophysomyces ossiformis]
MVNIAPYIAKASGALFIDAAIELTPLLCIEIIEHYGGDVVKFLGDAVLVSFQPDPADSETASDPSSNSDENLRDTSSRQKYVLVRRAVECGLQLLARQSHYRVYLTAEERSKHRSSTTGEIERRTARDKKERFFLFDSNASGVDSENQRSSSSSERVPFNLAFQDGDLQYPEEYSMTFSIWNCLPFLGLSNRKSRSYARRTSVSSDTSGRDINSIDLELHIALACGKLTNLILGEIEPEDTEPPLSPSATSDKRKSYIMSDKEDYQVEYNGRLEYAVCGPVVESLEEALSAAQAGEMSITREAYHIIQKQAMNLTYEKRRQFYIVKNADNNAHARKGNAVLRHHPLSSTKLPLSTPNVHYLADRPGLMKNAAKLNIEPIVPRIRNTAYMDISSESNPHYFKYLNRSALYRLQHSTDDNFPAQFRDATIMFISLGKLDVGSSDGINLAQESVLLAMRTLVKYEGSTCLAVFGLPPLSHEREAVFAAKAAIELRDAYRKLNLPDFSIALSTGIIFNAVLPQGNPYRRDPGIAGDTIVLAVRMLKFPFAKKNIVCDIATKQQIGGICEFVDYGENFVKGKVKPVPIYGIHRFGPGGKAKRISLQSLEKNTDFIGYKSEMAKATQFLDDWGETQNHHLLIISGPSGVVEKSSKYYLVKNLLLLLFDIIDSDKVPQNSRKRISHLSSSVHPHITTISSNGMGGSTPSTASSISFPGNRFRRLTSGSNVTRSSYGCTSMRSPDVPNEIAELIIRCLRKCGEDEGFLPLFKVVFANLSDLEENKYTCRLDGRGRDVLLIGVIYRMIRYVSEHIGLVFICDDVQWADSASIRILQQIHEHCQNVLLILATRPIKDYNVTFVKEFCATGFSEEIPLNGLGTDEIGEIILQTFETGVSKVSQKIVNVIQKRTGGNPLYVKNMAIILKDFNHVTVVDGELVPSSSGFDLEDLLGNFDYKRIIKMQFDRLDAYFQEFLTIASCLDQTFTIFEARAVITYNNNPLLTETDPRKIHEMISKYDVYNFLQQVVDSPIETTDEVYSFAHITIPQSIYDMVSYETRISIHRALAQYYEARLTRENYADLLGKVTRHYLQTDWFGKQIFYLEALAEVNMKSYLLPEATSNLQRIVQILDENEDLAMRFGRTHRSDIYRRLGICYTMRTKLTEGERYLFKALDCLGEPWPQSEPEFLFKYWKNRFSQYRHRRWGVLNKYTMKTKKELVRRIVEIMAQLSNIYFYTGKGRAFVYTCLVGLNACERLEEVGPDYTLFLARNSLLCWLNDQKNHSVFYITKALRHMHKKNDAGTLTICAFLYFAAGKFKMARELLYQSIDAVKTLGVVTDCQAFYRSVGLVITMRIFEGTLDNSDEDFLLLKQMADTAHSNGDYEAEIWLGVYNIGNALIKNHLRHCEPFVALLEAHVKQAADYNRIAIHGTLLYYYARSRNYEYARRHTRNLVSILPALTVTPNIFPIFGLIFATMGMYCMVEDEQVDLVSTDSKTYDRFVSGVARLNHAFQQVKFWEFTQPCLYLARALPYISTDRTVEGYMVLRHGVFEMHFIQEIRFLKAYYWSMLGKYAFTPADRIEWTERAKADLENLQIPSHMYCNPDPAKCYSRGTPADLCA